MWWIFAAGACSNGGKFFGLVPWYRYLDYGERSIAGQEKICEVKNFQVLGSNSDIPLVLLAVIDNLLRIAGLVAVAFVIYGAIKYTTSQGNPEDTNKAQSTIVNALGGLVIAMVAVALVTYIGGRFSTR